MPTICPFCDVPGPTPEHVLSYHRDRIRAARVYHERIEAGEPVPAARAAANRLVLRRGPGQYARASA